MTSLAGLVFVTSSQHKRREVEGILGVSLLAEALDLDEVQGLDVVSIARHKALQAFERLGRAVLVEDTALELPALGGFPGPLIRWLLVAAGPAVLPRLLADFPDKRAVARCVAVARDGAGEWVGEGRVEGVIVAEPRGDSGFGWDIVFAPEWGGGRTYAELSADEKNARSHRALAFAALGRRLRGSGDQGISGSGVT